MRKDNGNLPNFLIVGAARCGTTYLSNILMQHPEIFLHPKKELHFFDRDINKGLQYYREYFSGTKTIDYKAIGEATPAYLYFENIPEIIHKNLPDVKIIIILRNPVDRAYSHYWNIVFRSKEAKNITFDEMLKRNNRLVNEGFYFKGVEKYINLFSSNNVMILFYEKFMSNKINHLIQIFKFLHVNSDFIPDNMGIKYNSSSIKHGRSKILYYFSIFFSKYVIIPSVAGFFQRLNSKNLPEMKKETRKHLLNIYKEANKRLAEITGENLDIWNN